MSDSIGENGTGWHAICIQIFDGNANFVQPTLVTDALDEPSNANLKVRPMKSPFPEHSSTPPNELAVIGENKDDPSRLLLLGSDGRYYAYSLPNGEPEEVEPDDDWKIESQESEELFT